MFDIKNFIYSNMLIFAFLIWVIFCIFALLNKFANIWKEY